MPGPEALVLRSIRFVNYAASGLSMRLTRWTGRVGERIHPKHLVAVAGHAWYLDHLGPADVVLDVGSAHGEHASQIAPRVRRVVGLEYSADALGAARRLAPAGVFVRADAQGRMPFADGSFDKVVFLDVIEHLHMRNGALREIRRVLKNDGRLLVSAPNVSTRWKRRLKRAGLFYFGDPDHKVEYTEDSFRNELARGGFVPETPLAPVVFDTPWAGLIDLLGGVSLRAYATFGRRKVRWAQLRPSESTGFRTVCRKA